MKNSIKYVFFFMLITFISASCKKYLEEKPNKQLYVPNNWQDLQALLNSNALMNMAATSTLPELISDNLYVKDERWNSTTPDLQGSYIWNDKVSQYTYAWSLPYAAIYNVNVVLENLEKIRLKSPQKEINDIEGSALFFRAFAFFHLLQLYSQPYSQNNLDDLGIVLKLSGSITEKVTRVTIRDSYTQIFSDLDKALELLPDNVQNVMRPSKLSVKALLARIYLNIGKYDEALNAAKYVVDIRPDLLDFNTLMPANSPVMITYLKNPEMIFLNVSQHNGLTTSSIAIIDSSLYSMYADDDIRKKAFYSTSNSGGPGTYRFKGSYYNIATASVFNGLAIDEMYLIYAECLIRKDEVNHGLEILNHLLRNRYKVDKFTEYKDLSKEEAMNVILNERRKELIFRGLRWSDIRRLNLEGGKIELKRIINGNTYILPPNDLKYVLLIPFEEISRSGIQQNPR